MTPKVLKLLDFKLPTELIECAPRATRIHVGEDCFPFETDRTLVYMTSRAKLDTFLTEKAVEVEAELRDGEPVKRIEVTSSYVNAKTPSDTYRSRIVIGADGMGGPTPSDARLYDSWKPHQVAYAIESEVPVGEKAVQDFIGAPAYFDIYFGVSQAGYGWVFPKDDHLTVGVACRLSKLRDAQGLFYDFVKRIPELTGYEIPKLI